MYRCSTIAVEVSKKNNEPNIARLSLVKFPAYFLIFVLFMVADIQ